MVSGVWVWDWMARKLARRWVISAGVKPAVRRRSKPRGAGVVVVVVVETLGPDGSRVVVEGEVGAGRARAASAVDAARVSAVRSVGESGSPMEQWM